MNYVANKVLHTMKIGWRFVGWVSVCILHHFSDLNCSPFYRSWSNKQPVTQIDRIKQEKTFGSMESFSLTTIDVIALVSNKFCLFD